MWEVAVQLQALLHETDWDPFHLGFRPGSGIETGLIGQWNDLCWLGGVQLCSFSWTSWWLSVLLTMVSFCVGDPSWMLEVQFCSAFTPILSTSFRRWCWGIHGSYALGSHRVLFYYSWPGEMCVCKPLEHTVTGCKWMAKHFKDKVAWLHSDLDAAIVTVSPEVSDLTLIPVFWDHFQLMWPEDVDRILTVMYLTTCSIDSCSSWLIKASWVGGTTGWAKGVLNASLHNEVVPTALKEAVVHPLLKKPTLDTLECNNYRLVTNTPFFAEVVKRMVVEQLQVFPEETLFRSTTILVQTWLWNWISLGRPNRWRLLCEGQGQCDPLISARSLSSFWDHWPWYPPRTT